MNKQRDSVPTEGEEVQLQERRELISLQVTLVCMGIAAIILLTVVIQLLVVGLVNKLAPALAQKEWFSVVVGSVPMYLVAMPISYCIFRLGKSFAPKCGQRLSFWAIAGLLAISFGVAILGNGIGAAVQTVLSHLTGKELINPVEQATQATPFWANLLFLGILAPVAEELVCRKLVIDRLRPLGDLASVVVSGLLFGLIHGNFSQFFYAAMFGIVAGAVYVQTGKLRYTIAMHMAVNLTCGVFLAEVMRAAGGGASFIGQSVAAYLYYGYVALMVVCVALTPLLLYLWSKRTATRMETVNPSPKGVVGILLRQPAVWVFFALACLLFVL